MIAKNLQTILITGASGMLGCKLVEVLGKKYKILQSTFDITDNNSIVNEAKKIKHIDVLIHCAAMTNVDECERNQNECWKINVIGTENVTRLAGRYGAKLIYISTPMVFSGTKGNYREHDRTGPQNYYARSKLAGEKIVLRYKNGLVIRANPIGKRPAGSFPSFIQWFVERAIKNESFYLFSDVTINPISTTTMAKSLELIMQNFKPGIAHLGSKDTVSKADIWKFILKRFPEYSAPVVLKPVSLTPAGKIANRPRHMWLHVEGSKRFKIALPSWRKEVETVLKELGI